MFCCCEPSTGDYGNQNDHYSTFPGDRRFKTGGNALAQAPQQPLSSGQTVVAVVVPQGVSAGQTIRVTCPDGSRSMNATVPSGMGPGQMFTVTFPPEQGAFSPAILQEQPMQPPPTAPPHQHHQQQQAPAVSPFSQALDAPLPQPMMPPSSAPVYAAAVPVKGPRTVTPPMISATPIPAQVGSSGGQSLLLVQVPPGTPAGSTIHVEIPGEGRTLAAQVPAGVQQFHVAYTPHHHHQQHQQQQQMQPQEAVAVPHQQPVPAGAVPIRQTTGRQKLILVQVPPGCAVGTTLHVSVPDEPGRLLAAVVPPGNVREFHVSYEARSNNNSIAAAMQPPQNAQQRAMLPPSNGYQQQQQQQRGGGGRNMNPMNRNSRGGGMGGMMLPMLGGAAMGAGGVMAYDHFAHNNASDSNAYGDTAADNGGGGDYDYDSGGGGDYDGGGGDWDAGGGDWDAGGFDF